ncbi:tetratricopeptide repeat protein [Parapedobacter koreensis]|uniref:AraC-type DNA-binding protein n=1 Tax=Parapedobacter koreensis TaxID=332977 RepID=A0A1H7TJW4_9SPHI|nr:tetratricopeptide repeat protein [Parapedobacter koreensis]SEL84779.1 AraC-type DNA-binding protein [Parapedobacter koreensis]
MNYSLDQIVRIVRICPLNPIFSFIFFLFLFAPLRGFNAEIDLKRLEKLDNKTRKDTADLAEMLTLTTHLAATDPDQALAYLDRIKTEAEEKHYYNGIIEYCTQFSDIYGAKGSYNETAFALQKLYDKHEQYLSADQQVAIKALKATALANASRFDESLAITKEILPLAENPLRRAQVYFQQASSNRGKGNHKEAIADFLAALKLYQTESDSANVASVLNGLGNSYADLNDQAQSIGYYKKALRYAEQMNDLTRMMTVYSNIGTVYRQVDSNDLALRYFDKGLQLAKKLKHTMLIAQNLMNIGNIQLKMNQADKALDSYQASIKLCYGADIKYGVMINYANIGELYHRQGNYMEAKRAYDSVMAYVKLLELPFEEAKIHEHYAKLYADMGQYQTALDHHKTFHELKEKIINEKNQETIAELQVAYQTELKDQEIALVNQKLQEKKIQNKALLALIALVLLATGFAMFFLVYRNRTLRELYDRSVELSATVDLATANADENYNETDSNLQLVFSHLLRLLKEEHIYKDPNLSIGKIAEQLKTNEKYVSAAIAAHAKMNYSNFINFYRINEAKRLIHELEHTTTLNEVMYACGFRSRTTFYDSFSKFVGMSPKQFKHMAKSAEARATASTTLS